MRVRFVMALVCGGIALTGCETLENALTGVERPTASVSAVRIADLAADGATLDFDLAVNNPYGFGLPLGSVAYRLDHGSTNFLTGSANLDTTVPAGDSAVVTLPASIVFADALEVLRSVRPGEVFPYTAELDLAMDVPGVGPMTLPLRTTGELPVPAPPGITVRGIDWSELTMRRAAGRLVLDVENRNAFPVELASFDYALSLAGTRVAETVSRRSTSFGAGDTATLEIPVAISATELGLAAYNILRGRESAFSLAGDMAFDTGFGVMSLPVNQAGTLPLRR
ncbi:MAG: LEA type 2 family protein [Planctomycetes bacterium]|nr:LEA type 2 family protein [Planctomycetota bacterium]